MYKCINESYLTKDKFSLPRLFAINDNSIINCIITLDLNRIIKPFNIVLQAHKNMCLNFTYATALEVLRTLEHVELNNRCVKQIIKNVLFARKLIFNLNKSIDFFDKNMVAELETNEKEFRRQLFVIYVIYLDKGNSVATYICNILCMLHFEKNNYKFISDLVKSNTIMKKNIDYYVFMYHKGLINIYNEALAVGYECFIEAMKLKPIRKFIIFPVLLISLLTFNNKIIKNKINVYKYDSEDKVLDLKEHIIPELVDDFLISENGFYIESFIKLKQIVTNGFIINLEYGMKYKYKIDYKKLHLQKIMDIYLPLMTLRNLIYRIYAASNFFNKFTINEINKYCELPLKDLQFYILTCFDKGIIRGYLSVSKNVLVLSKEYPFPDIILSNKVESQKIII